MTGAAPVEHERRPAEGDKESTQGREKSKLNLRSTISCPACGKGGYGSKIGSGPNGTKCVGKIKGGDAMVDCTYVFRGAHHRQMEAKKQKVEDRRANSARSDSGVKPTQAAKEFDLLKHEGDMFQAKHGGSVFVAWVTPIESSGSMQDLDTNPEVCIEQGETALPFPFRTAVALFQHASVSINGQLATSKIYGKNIKSVIEAQFKTRAMAFHKEKTTAAVKAAQGASSQQRLPGASDSAAGSGNTADPSQYGDLKLFLTSAKLETKWFEKLREQDITLHLLKAGFKGVPGMPKVDLDFLTTTLGLSSGAALTILEALGKESFGDEI